MSQQTESETIVRLKAMKKAFDAGTFVSPNHPNGKAPERNYDDMPDDTVYAGIPPEKE